MSKRTPEEEAARKLKQIATAQQPKCPCGNCAPLGKVYCSACYTKNELELQKIRSVEVTRYNLVNTLSSVLPESHSIVQDLEEFIEAKIGELQPCSASSC